MAQEDIKDKASSSKDVKVAVETKQYPARASVRAVHGGPMINPTTQDKFTGEPSKMVDIDAWIITQVEAEKIAIVE